MSGRARSGASPASPDASRSVRRAAVLALLLVTVTPAGPARAGAESPAESRSAPTQDGWWNRLQGPPEGEPDGNPVRPLIPPAPKPPNVPGDTIAAGAGGGQPDKVAAVGLGLALADGASLDRLTLRLKESPAGGANVGAEAAKVTACPATVAWGPAQNAAWRERPTADCSLASASGARAADGTWTFDLTAIGRLWADPFAPLAPNGVVLAVDPAGSPSPVQVTWLDFDSGNVAVELTATPGVPAAPGPDGRSKAAAPVAAAFVAPTPTPPSVAGLAGPWAVRGGGQSADPFAYPQVLPANASVTPAGTGPSAPGLLPGPPAETTLAAAPGRTEPVLRARSAVDFWERVPAPTALLVPVAVGLAILIGVVLGPLGRPSPVFRREGGLSRALARRNPAGSDPRLHPPAAVR